MKTKGRVVAVGLGVVLAAALVYQLDRARDRLHAQTVLRTVQLVSSQMVASGRVVPRVLWHHVRVLEDAEVLEPSNVALPLARGSQYLLLGRFDEAAEVYEEALALEVRPEIHLNLGRAYARAGDAAKAREHFAAAVELAPHLRRQVPRELRGGG